jgi:hypothetical protein
MSRDAPKAVGYHDGRRRTIRLDACSLCNLKGIGADLAVSCQARRGNESPISGARPGHSRIGVVTAQPDIVTSGAG